MNKTFSDMGDNICYWEMDKKQTAHMYVSDRRGRNIRLLQFQHVKA